MTSSTIVVHGGAGRWSQNRKQLGLTGVRKAAARGARVLEEGGSCQDAVEAAIVSMEDNPVFNAGTGSTFNLLGEVEMDAAIMSGRTLEGAGVALVTRVKNPIRLARIVMEKTDHVLMAGRGAEQIAAAFNLPRANVRVRPNSWLKARLSLRRRPARHFKRNVRLLRASLIPNGLDTVGALALDSKGNVAAGCSTGGMALKLPGRIGDSAILGAGLYADNRTGAATATGIGEMAMRLVISKVAVDFMRYLSANQAATQTIALAGKKIGRGLGMIALDRKGTIGIAHNTPNLCWAAMAKRRTTFGISAVH